MFGGLRHGERRYCSESCATMASVHSVELAPGEVEELAQRLAVGPCEQCGSLAAVDLHQSWRVISAVYVSFTSSPALVACGACARRAILRDLMITLVAGWWGLEGLIVTPVFVIRGVASWIRTHQLEPPSPELHDYARVTLALKALSERPEAGDITPPLGTPRPYTGRRR
jgi:hypothetical protein